jgi:mRNA interferase YafQ
MKVVYSSKFKKDLKRYQNQPHKIRALGEVIKHLKKHGRVPMEYRPHRLHGIFKGSMECHIEDDFLLIWVDEATNTVKLLRFGTHHELLGI